MVAQKAGYAYAKSEYERQQRMYKQNATSLNNVEKWAAKTIQTQAEIDEAVANADDCGNQLQLYPCSCPF